jgi:hypothetical protein
MNFLNKFSKNNQISNFIKICPIGAAFFHADGWMDGWTDTMKLIVALCNFENVPKKIIMHISLV